MPVRPSSLSRCAGRTSTIKWSVLTRRMLSVAPKVALPNTSLYSLSGFEPFDFSHFSPSFPVFIHFWTDWSLLYLIHCYGRVFSSSCRAVHHAICCLARVALARPAASLRIESLQDSRSRESRPFCPSISIVAMARAFLHGVGEKFRRLVLLSSHTG